MMKLYYLGKSNNFGDAINYQLFTQLYGQRVKRSRYYRADYAAIGSILGKFFYDPTQSRLSRQNLKKSVFAYCYGRSPVTILGSGLIEDLSAIADKLVLSRTLDIRALRGAKTLAVMQNVMNDELNQVVLGDPGLLVNRLFEGAKIKKRFRLGIIPHYADFDSPLLHTYRDDSDVALIDIKGPAQEFMKVVNECELIASSSLHGLVVADSFGIPAVWIRLSDAITGGDYKFLDYFSSLGIQRSCHDLRNDIECLNRLSSTDGREVGKSVLAGVTKQLDSALARALL